MRPTLTIVLAICTLGALQAFLSMRQPTDGSAPGATIIAADGEYSLEITLSFDAGPDQFSFDARDATSLLVSRDGRELVRRTDAVSASTPISLPKIEGLVVGRNEFFVQATSANANSLTPHAVQVRILQGGHPLAEKTLWAAAGEPVQGTLVVEIPE